MKHFLSVLALFAASVALGQDLTIDGGNNKVVSVDQIIVTKVDKILVQSLPFTVKAPPGAFDYRWSYPATVSVLDMGDTLKVTAAPKGSVTVGVVIKTIDFDKKKVDSKFSELSFLVGEVPVPIPVPPEPKPPEPKPPEPTPVKSFRVVFIYESSKTLTAKENSVMNAKVVRDWLGANTTAESGWQGWRVWDKDTDPANDSSTMKSLWAAIKPQITSVPCVAVEVNGHVEIIPLAATPLDMIAVFSKYKGGA
jgi:hypothetical protein